MLVVVCPRCSCRELLPLSRVLAVTSGLEHDGRVVHRLDYRCWCGHTGTDVIHGPRRKRPPQPNTPPVPRQRREETTT